MTMFFHFPQMVSMQCKLKKETEIDEILSAKIKTKYVNLIDFCGVARWMEEEQRGGDVTV